MAREDKLKALDAAISQIEKQYGKGSIMKLGDNSAHMNVETIPTGSLSLDIALGLGGLPKGRIIEIYGPESSGKTTLALHVLAEAQKRGGEVAFVDAEHALDPVYAAAIGVDIDSMLVSQPDTGEQALDITDALVRSGAIDVVVVDSVAALTPRAEIEGEMGEAFVGLQARLMSQALRKLAGTVSKTNCIVIFINQLRMKIGVMYGNPETTTGGNALKFYSSVRLDVRKIEAIKSGTEIVGNRTRVKVIKNKCAPPFREAVFDIMYGEGISRFGELLDIAVTLELINKSGSWFSVGDERIGQGRDNAKQYIADHPELAAELEHRLRQKGESPENARQAVEWLAGLSLLDEEAAARQIVRSGTAKGYGAARIRQMLYAKHIPRELWDEALAELPEQDDAIDAFLQKRFRGRQPDRTEIRRAADALLRRGHAWGDIRRALERYDPDLPEE